MRQSLIILGAVLLVAVAVGAVWYWIYPKAATLSTSPSSVVQPAPVANPTPVPGAVPISVPQPAAPTVVPDITFAALTFAETYGSYSSDAPFANFAAATQLATSAFAAQLAAQSATRQPTPPAGTFYGVSTRGLSAQVQNKTSDAATVVVKTQRQERFARTGEIRVSYQDLTLQFTHADKGWLVASATWNKQ